MKLIIVAVLLGSLAGYLSAQITRYHGIGMPANIVVGVVGGIVGHWLIAKLNVNLGGEWLAYSIHVVIGATTLLWIVNFLYSTPRDTDN